MVDARAARSARLGTRREAWFVAALAAFAFARVFALSAALPFFNGIDEHMHVDLVQKYARGFLPGPDAANFDPIVVQFFASFASPEYLKDSASFDGGRFPTPEQKTAERPPGSPDHAEVLALYASRPNIEAEAPPTYYALGGAWMRLGRALGLTDLDLLYWIRLLNPLLAGVVVGLTYAFLRRRCSDHAFRRLGPCMFLAGYPNDLQYGVTPDVLSIGLGALCFFGLVRMREIPREIALAAATGFVIGVAFLNKYPNVLFVGAASTLAAIGMREARREGTLRSEVANWLALGRAATAPAIWWLERNLHVVGSLSGTHRKVQALGWSPHGPDQILAHPLFTASGWIEFIPALLRTFWQGEFAWHGAPTHTFAVDALYVVTSLLFIGAAARGWIRARHDADAPRRIDGIALLCCAVGVTVLAVLSTLFDFGIDEGPISRSFPFVASGRLLAGLVAPFAILYCNGLEAIWSRAGARWARIGPWLVLGAVLAIALGWQFLTFRDAFGSSWNWFHAR